MKKNSGRRLMAIVLALVMILTCAFASASTVTVRVSADQEAVKEILSGLGIPEEQKSVIEPILSLMNLLGIRVITAEDGAQIDVELDGDTAFSLGFATDEQGIRLAGTLFPHYLLILQQDALSGILNIPGANVSESGEGTMSIMPTSLSTYIASFLQVGTEAVVPGEPVKGDYLFDGSHFDTMIPVAVDVSRVREAFPGWKEDLLKDESVLSSLQGIPQAGGQKLTPESLKAVLDGIEKYFPDEVTVEYYQNGENPFPFHMAARAVRAGKPLLSVSVTAAASGERTLSMETGEKTVIRLEEILGGESEAASGLLMDVMMNGIGPLMTKLFMSSPEAAGLITLLMMPQQGSNTTAGTEQTTELPVVADPSSWKTLADVLSLDTESRESSWDDHNYTMIFKYAGTEWLVNAAFTKEQADAVRAVDFMARDRDEQIRAIIGPCEIGTVIDLSLLAAPQEELDRWIGKTGQDLLDAGWEYNGYHSDETGIHVILVNGEFQYQISFAEEMKMSQVFGEQPENMASATVTEIRFDGKSYHFNEEDYIKQRKP